MQKDAKVSCRATIIIPVYRAEMFLKQCLDSVLHQNIGEYEIICVNDCSPDSSDVILQHYAEAYPGKVTVLENEENIGQGRSRMRAVAQASGEYVFFVDSDDYVAENYLESFLRETENCDYDVIISGHTRVTDGVEKKWHVVDSPLTMVTYSVACCKAFRKAFLLENHIDFTDKRAGEDIFFNAACYAANARWKCIEYYGYYYRLNPQSTTQSLNYQRNFEHTVSEMFKLLMERYYVSELPSEKRYVLQYAYVSNMVNALITYDRGCGRKIMRERYDFFWMDLRDKFPDFGENPYFKKWRPKGPSIQNALAVAAVMKMLRHGSAWPIFGIVSRMK